MTAEAIEPQASLIPLKDGVALPYLVTIVYNNGESTENRYRYLPDARTAFDMVCKAQVTLFASLTEPGRDDGSLDAPILATFLNPNLAVPVNRA